MAWVLWLVGLAVLVTFGLAAIGALGSLDDEDDFAAAGSHNAEDRTLPLALFGYRRDVVDRLLAELSSPAAQPPATKPDDVAE